MTVARKRRGGRLTPEQAEAASVEEAIAEHVIWRFQTDQTFCAACQVDRRSRAIWCITPPDWPKGKPPVVWHRRDKSEVGGGRGGVGRKPRAVDTDDLMSERLLLGLVGLAKTHMDTGTRAPRAAQQAVDSVKLGPALTPERRETAIVQVLRLLRKLGYRRVKRTERPG